MTGRRCAAAAALLLCTGAARTHAATVEGTVRAVADGDTYFVDTGAPKWMEVRVFGIDCPEGDWPAHWPAQPHADEAKALARRLVDRKRVRVEIVDRDRYGREVGEVSVGGRSVGEAMVGAGLAWWNARYAPDDLRLRRLEDRARAARRGLWADAKPEAPWRYRQRYRGKE